MRTRADSSEDAGTGAYGLRKRRRGRVVESCQPAPLEKLLDAAERSSRIIVFSGSGLSATSGMSTFSTKGGLYERAQKKFKLSDGKTLFTYTFFDKRRLEAQAFFADIYLEAIQARPAPGHCALAALCNAGRLHRHYTLNIDGLAGMVGLDTWHPETNPDGVTVEMHGDVRLLVCVECGATLPISPTLVRNLKAQRAVPCAQCNHEAMRFKVMMYEDAESEAITPEEVMDLMEEDVKQADLILWVGISFQQSASTVYFRNVRKWLAEAGREDEVLQAVINPSDEALWNLMTASSNQTNLNVVEVLAESDEVLPQLAARLAQLPPGACRRRLTSGAAAQQPHAAAAPSGQQEKDGHGAAPDHQQQQQSPPLPQGQPQAASQPPPQSTGGGEAQLPVAVPQQPPTQQPLQQADRQQQNQGVDDGGSAVAGRANGDGGVVAGRGDGSQAGACTPSMHAAPSPASPGIEHLQQLLQAGAGVPALAGALQAAAAAVSWQQGWPAGGIAPQVPPPPRAAAAGGPLDGAGLAVGAWVNGQSPQQ